MKTRAVVLQEEIELAREATAGACQSHSCHDCLEGDCQNATAPSTARDALRDEILEHLQTIGLNVNRPDTPLSKDQVRHIHRLHRQAARDRILKALGNKLDALKSEIADGVEIDPAAIQPYLVPVRAGTLESDLFRFATLQWSIPVSQGYGRRLRFLVRDRANGKLIGLFALGDPVFNLRARDNWIGWDQAGRRERLVNVMDAYVVGAVPPYSILLGGKLVTSLMASKEVSEVFDERYGDRKGTISGTQKNARLALITVTSALGKSSMHNRLKLFANEENRANNSPVVELRKIGATTGYGHFQISDELFSKLRELLRDAEHPYADGYKFGNGPNWRLRLLRAGLEFLELNADHTLKHGIQREVYVMPLACNAKEYLAGIESDAAFDHRSVKEISNLAIKRWMAPRARRDPSYLKFQRKDFGHENGVHSIELGGRVSAGQN